MVLLNYYFIFLHFIFKTEIYTKGVIPSLDENKGHLAPSIANRIIGNALGIRVAKVTT